MDDMDSLGALLTRLRRRAGLTVPQVRDAMGVARSTAYGWERNPNGMPGAVHLQRLLDLFDATAEERLLAFRLRAQEPAA